MLLKMSRHAASEMDPHGYFKFITLDLLIKNGSVDIEQLRARWSGLEWYREITFRDAVSVIEAYNSGDILDGALSVSHADQLT
jgi:hypothetical protein